MASLLDRVIARLGYERKAIAVRPSLNPSLSRHGGKYRDASNSPFSLATDGDFVAALPRQGDKAPHMHGQAHEQFRAGISQRPKSSVVQPLVFKKGDNVCNICSQKKNLTDDHVPPRCCDVVSQASFVRDHARQ